MRLHPSFHLECCVVFHFEYQSSVNPPLCFTSPRYTCLLLDVRVFPLADSGTWEPSGTSPRTPPLSPRWPLGGARPQSWALSSRLRLSSASIWSCLLCKHLQWLNLLFVCPAWVTVIFFFFCKVFACTCLARRCGCQMKYKKKILTDTFLTFPL